MATNVGAVNIAVNYVVNQATTRNITNSINNLQNRAPRLQSAFTGAFGKIGMAITAAFSVKAITDFSKKCLELASNLQEVQNVVDVTFGGMTDKVNKFAKAAIVNLGMSETSAKKYAGTFGAMAKSFGFGTEQATNMALAITSLTGDVASFYNLSHDLAYTKLKSIFTGETETLKDLGVVMTQTALNQYALANGYAKTVKEMTEQEKVVLRYNFVMEKLALAQGDFTRTQTGWANQTRILSERWKAILASVGDGLIILLTPAIQALNTFLSYLQIAADKFAGFVALLTGKKVDTSSQAKAQMQVAAIGATAQDSSDSLSDLASGYEKAGSAAKKASESLASFDNVVQLSDTSSSGSGGSGGGAGGVGSSIPEYTFTDNEELKESDTIIDKITNKLAKFKDYFSGLFDVESIKTSFQSIGTSIVEIFEGLRPSAINFTQSFAQSMLTGVTALTGVGISVIDAIVGGMALHLEQEKERITTQWSDIYNNCAGWFDNMGLLLFDLGALLSNFFSLETTKQAIANALATVEGAVTGTYLIITGLYEEISLFISKTIDENFAGLNTFCENTSALLSQLTGTIKTIIQDCFSSVYDTFNKYIRPAFEQFQEGFSYAFGKVVECWNQSIFPLLNTIAVMFDNLWTTHLKPFVDQVLGMAGAFIEAVASVYNFAIKPYMAYMDELWAGISVILGFIVGAFEGSIGGIIDLFSGLVEFLKGIFEVISGIFQGDGQKVCDGLVSIFKGLFNSIVSIFTSIVNTIISAVNGVIRTINKMDIPGKDLGVSIPEVPKWKPQLADGGIVYRQTDFGDFIAGEAGAEAIVPLENSGYTQTLAREIVKGMLEAGMGGDTYNISAAYMDRKGLERLTQDINGVNKQISARKGVVAYGY